MGEAVDQTPLLVGCEDSSLKPAISECKLVDKCFLSDGAAAKTSSGFKKVQRKLVIACILCFIFMTIEVIGGYMAKSVAIMSDAAHMLSDVSAFLVSIFATWAATQPSSWHYSFGYHRAEILGALISVLTIWAVTGALVFEAFQRVINPVVVDGKLMFIIAMSGVVFNILIGLTLGVHAHLGHSHGPGDCGHGHDHGHDHEHGHDHSHGHSHGACNHSHNISIKQNHSHSHGESSKHARRQDKAKEQEHGNGDHCHSHDHSDDDHHLQSEDEHETGHSSEHKHGGHCSRHSQSHSDRTATAAQEDSVVIDLPAAAAGLDRGASCGLDGHALTCKCTISKLGSREIEVHCELPAPPSARPASSNAAAASRTRRNSHSYGSHGHGHGDDAGSINLRSAVLHVIGDLLQSIGVAIAGALIWYNQDDPRWNLADPICTFLFSIVVLLTTKSILRDIVHVLMERTPTNMDIPAVARVMLEMEGIWDVHDLHVWNISTSMKPVLTAHVHIGPDADATVVLQQLEQYVRGLGIDHSTIQICNIQPQPDAPDT